MQVFQSIIKVYILCAVVLTAFTLFCDILLVFLGGWSFVTCEGWWGRGLCSFRESLKDFQTDPPIHHSFLEMTSHCAHSECNVQPVCHGNYEYPGYKSCRSSPHTFSIVGVYYLWLLYSISYHACYCFVLLS